MPRVWLWIREHIYIELERIAQDKGIGVDDLLKKLIEDYIQGRLLYRDEINEGELIKLKRRIKKLEEEVNDLKNIARLILKRIS